MSVGSLGRGQYRNAVASVPIAAYTRRYRVTVLTSSHDGLQLLNLFLYNVSAKFFSAAELNDDGAILRRHEVRSAGRNHDEAARRIGL